MGGRGRVESLLATASIRPRVSRARSTVNMDRLVVGGLTTLEIASPKKDVLPAFGGVPPSDKGSRPGAVAVSASKLGREGAWRGELVPGEATPPRFEGNCWTGGWTGESSM